MTIASPTCAGCGDALREVAHFCPRCGAAVVRTPRLNPFAFPVETDFRFLLLVVAVVGGSVLLLSMLYNVVPANWDALQSARQRCAAAQLRQDAAARAAVSDCLAPLDRARAAWILTGVLMLVIAAGGLFWAMPRVMLRRHQLNPLGDKPPGLRAELAAMATQAGLQPAPTFVFSRLFRSARAFGWRGRYYVALGRGLLDDWTAQPARDARVRAVIRHELAHIHNADVEKTYFTIAICVAFALVIVAPLAVTLIDNPLAFTLGLGWRVVALIALVALAGASVLRARETYADLRASQWDGARGALRALLSEQVSAHKAKHWHPLRVHPEPLGRRAALDDTDPLFEIGLWDVFGIGVAITVAFQNIALLLIEPLIVSPLVAWALRPFAVGLITGLLVAPLLVGVVGAGVWRATLAMLAGRSGRPRIWRLALALGVGMLVGQKLSFFEFSQEQSEQALRGLTLIVFDAVWCGLLVACLAVFLRWVAESAEAWLPVAAARPSPRPFYRAGLTIAGGVLAVLLGIFYLAYLPRVGGPVLEYVTLTFEQYGLAPPATAAQQSRWLAGAVVAGLVLNPLTTLALTALWAYPLAASARRRAAALPAWGLLDAESPLPARSFARLQPRRTLFLGVSGGLVYGLAAMIVWAMFLRGAGGAMMLTIMAGLPALSVLIQIGVALAGALGAADLRLVHGIGAASIAGLLAALCTILPFGLLGVLPLSSALAIAAVVINGGGLAALAVAFCVATTANLIRRQKPI